MYLCIFIDCKDFLMHNNEHYSEQFGFHIIFCYIVWSEKSLIKPETAQISYSTYCSLKVQSKITINQILTAPELNSIV